jgi:2-iminobutanoate/2-iminopropanoate deaminase
MTKKLVAIVAIAAAAVVLATTALVQAYQPAASRRYFTPRTPADAAQPPFSGAVLAGNTLYLSGDIGTIGTGANRRVPDTAEAEAKVVLDNVQATLKASGMTMDDLVSVQIFCSDVKHYDAFNSVYRTYFTKEFPARAFIGSGTLLFNARFEVQGIAVKR